MSELNTNPLIELALIDKLRPIFDRFPEEIYLVGGAVRDLILGRPIHDFDFALPRKAIKLAFKVGDELGYPAYILDLSRDTARVVLDDTGTTIDFAAYRSETLSADLGLRDFTINAMALPTSVFEPIAVIDPYGGMQDIENKVIRPTNREVLRSDPLRVLRAVRLAAELDFSLSSETEGQISSHRSLLGTVSGERIRDEIIRILTSQSPIKGLRLLFNLKLYPFFPLNRDETRDIVGEPLQDPGSIDRLFDIFTYLEIMNTWISDLPGSSTSDIDIHLKKLSGYSDPLCRYFDRKTEGGLNGWILLKLGALYSGLNHAVKLQEDSGELTDELEDPSWKIPISDFTKNQLRVLRLSKAAQRHIMAVIRGGQQSRAVLIDQSSSSRGVYRFFRDCYPAGLDVAWIATTAAFAYQLHDLPNDEFLKLLSGVDHIFDCYFNKHDKIIKPVPLIDGLDLIRELEVKPGPDIGILLKSIEEEQAAGGINNRSEAIAVAKQQYEDLNK